MTPTAEQKAAAWDRLTGLLLRAKGPPGPEAAGLLAEVTDNHRLREALTWAVGFLRCHHPNAERDYPDFRNAAALVAAQGPVFTGEFQLTLIRAELAEARAETLLRLLKLEVAAGVRVVRVRAKDGTLTAQRHPARRWLAAVTTEQVSLACETDASGAMISRREFDERYEAADE
jgi:hypothetical protein